MFFKITRGISLWSITQFHGTNRQVEVIPSNPASSAVCRCLHVRLLSKNHPGLECSPSGASGGRVTWRRSSCVCSHSSNITTSCVYTARTVFLHLFQCEFIHALLPHCIAVLCDYRVARHPWRTLPLTEPEPEPKIPQSAS